MGLLANLKIRSKLLIALAPLAVMVVVAALYSSIESKKIDTAYTALIDQNLKALQSAIEARALTMRFGLFLYKEIAEPEPDEMRLIEGNLDKAYADYQAAATESLRDSPNRSKELKAAEALFDKAAFNARPVRAAVLTGDNVKAMKLMREGVDAELQQARQAMLDVVDELQKSVDRNPTSLPTRPIALS
jgi:hypothetical protein